MSALQSMARTCIAWLASENEREDRLGDLEELLGAVERKAGAQAATRRYLREAAAICLSIIQRRIRRAITNGGLDMARIILWAALSVGGVFLFREKGRQRLGVVEQTARDAYAAASIAGLFGCVHIMENLEEPLVVLGHLFGGALSAVFFGVILGRALIAPIASQLSALHEQQAREMEALRLSLGDRGRPVPAETFDVLASGLTSYA
jgi:hypothetical protein